MNLFTKQTLKSAMTAHNGNLYKGGVSDMTIITAHVHLYHFLTKFTNILVDALDLL